MKKWEDENAGTFLVLRRKTGMIIGQIEEKVYTLMANCNSPACLNCYGKLERDVYVVDDCLTHI